MGEISMGLMIDLRRRRWLGLGVTAVVSGLGACAAETSLAGTEVHDLEGQVVSLDAFAGKPVLVAFWATTCPACIEEMPLLQRLQADYGGRGFQVLGIAMAYDPIEQLRAFNRQRAPGYTVLHDQAGAAAVAAGGVRVTPTNLLLDAGLVVRARSIGVFNEADWRRRIERLLG